MKLILRYLLLPFSLIGFAAQAQIPQFQHIIIVFQENRTPDNFFYALCDSFPCSITPDGTQYNIQTSDWLDKTSPTGVTQPIGVSIANRYGVDHSHKAWKSQCDLQTEEDEPQCQMDGAAMTSKNQGAFAFVLNTVDARHPNGVLTPYLTLATQYGWANFMFQTNQGASFPAHQFIFGGTSALSPEDDMAGNFLADNPNAAGGCYAQDGERIHAINAYGQESTRIINYEAGIDICATRTALTDLLDIANVSWKYYSVKGAGADFGGFIWTAPNGIESICVPDDAHMNCTGNEWINHVDLNSQHILSDLGMNGSPCNLQGVSWVMPKGNNSDHGGGMGGPDWVGSIVNALGTSPCTNPDGSSYWNTTAVVVAWDDWGGWYDHVAPPLLPFPQGGYQLGFRVPLIFISAYTPPGYIDNLQYDFGSVLRFVENNFGLGEGALGFADSRAPNDFSTFYDLTLIPRPFVPVPTSKTGMDFLNDHAPPTAPDED